MTDWTAGYVADIGYTFGYYGELSPLRIKLAFLNAGVAFPEVGTACELGFGQGLSVNIHAAASPVAWYGTDFNPSQAAFARELATVAGAGACLNDQSFAEFCIRSDLPDFDYIGVHGIWSWVSKENQSVIVDFLRRKLKVGGVLYISYNTQPGWAAMVPMRHLLTEHAEIMGASGRGIVSQIDTAIEFADKLMSVNPIYARANPQMAERMKAIKEKSRYYLAHEYFNRDWQPIHFGEMAECLGSAKLSFACSAHPLDHVDAVNLTDEQLTFLMDIPNLMFRETVRDFLVNQQFRRDYWVKGSRRLTPLEQREALRKQRFMLVSPRSVVSLTVVGALGDASLNETIYGPVLDALAEYQPKSIGEIEQAVKGKGVSFGHLVQAVFVLISKGDLLPVQDDAAVGKVGAQTARLNQYLISKARGGNDIGFLASPVGGGGVSVGRFQQLFLAAIAQGRKLPAEWAMHAWEVLASQDQTLVKDGKPLEGAGANLAELTSMANEFANKSLSALRALGVA